MAEENTIQFGKEFNTSDFGLIDDGKYEVAIEKVEERESKTSGKKYLNFTFVIRTDVDQKFKNRRLFYTITKKDGDSCFDFNRINAIICTQEGRSDYKKYFKEFDEVLQYLHGLHLVIEVVTNFDDYKGEDRNEIKDFSFAPSLWDTQDHSTVVETSTEPVKSNTDKIELTDDDIPF